MQHQHKKTSSAVKKKKHYRPASVFKKKLRNVDWKISVRATSRPMSAIECFIQSLNEICMMSVRKCSIGVMRWCFFFRPRSVIFPGRRRLSMFSINIGEKYFFAEMSQYFPGRITGNMPISAETKRRLSSHKKTYPTYIVHFLCNTKTRKLSVP